MLPANYTQLENKFSFKVKTAYNNFIGAMQVQSAMHMFLNLNFLF